jgi:hypothetical protein
MPKLNGKKRSPAALSDKGKEKLRYDKVKVMRQARNQISYHTGRDGPL